MGTTYMYDSVNASSIPSNAQVVAGYVDGRYANYTQVVQRFPGALHVSITVFGAANTRVADCETGDLTPAQAATWAHGETQAGRRPTIYCNISTHSAVVSALAVYNLQFVRDVDWWAAGYTNSPYLASGSVATQYEDQGSYDLSETNGSWPAVTQPGTTPTVSPHPMLTGCAGMAVTATKRGYWLVQSNGRIVTHGDAVSYGDASSHPLNQPVVGIAATPTGEGYWLVAADGGVFSYGDAKFFGSMGGKTLNKPVVGMAATPSGNGYWLAAADGGVFAFGDAGFHGSMGGKALNKPVVGIAAYGGGYWLVASDGGVFNFGVNFQGSEGGVHLNAPAIGMAPTADGAGYWIVGADGGVFTFGDAKFYGSCGSQHLNQQVVGMVPSSVGYWLVAADGGVFTFGDAAFEGAGA